MTDKTADAAATMVANLKKNTGKSLDQWISLAKKTGAQKHGEIVKILKADHGLTHGYANLVAHSTLKSDAASMSETTDLVTAQYAGDKSALRPIYDAVIKAVTAFGQDVEIAPKKAYVSLRRNKQFALVQPSTKTRVDLGINLKNVAAGGRLEASGSFNAMVSHRVRLETGSDFNAEVKAWLKKAYEDS